MGDVGVFTKKAIDELENQRKALDSIGEKIKKFFEKLLSDNKISFCSVNARTKSAKSLTEKIYRKNYFSKYNSGEELIADLSDGIGVRISCLLSEDEEKIYELIFANFVSEKNLYGKSFGFEKESIIGLCKSKQPELQKNGLPIYRIDGVILCKEKQCEEELYIRFELQIKSLVHYLWGEIEHSLFYKKYDYIISNDYYAQLMKSINSELENVDRQICSLKAHMEQKDVNQAKNVREIAAYVLSRQFQKSLVEEIGCNIDLREVFDVIVDLHFLFVTSPEDGLKKLNEFVQEISKHDEVKKCYLCIENGTLDDDLIMPKYKNVANSIAQSILSGDIFWKSLVTVFASIKKIDNFSEIINEMAKKLKKLVLACSVEYDGIEDENIADTMVEITEHALVTVACKVNKVGFFRISNCLDQVRGVIANIGNMIQKKIVELNNVTIFEQNRDVLEQYICVVLYWACGEKIDSGLAVRMLDLLKKTNDYQLCFDKNVIEWIKELGVMNESQMTEFEELNEREDA